jgi:chemosensory pili system protein ChpC
MSVQSGQQSPPVREADIAVRSLLVPLDGMGLLVPNALVSEVATLSQVTPLADSPEWLLGKMPWRGLAIPLVSFEAISGGGLSAPTHNSRAIVFNTLNGNRELPFVAVLSQRIPRLLLVTARMLNRVEDAPPQDGVLTRIEMDGDEVLVPDMDWLEQTLIQQGIKLGRVIG